MSSSPLSPGPPIIWGFSLYLQGEPGESSPRGPIFSAWSGGPIFGQTRYITDCGLVWQPQTKWIPPDLTLNEMRALSLIPTKQSPTQRNWMCWLCGLGAGSGLGSPLEDLCGLGAVTCPTASSLMSYLLAPLMRPLVKSLLLTLAQVDPAIATENFTWIEHVHSGPCDRLRLPRSCFPDREEGALHLEGEGTGQTM